MKSQTARKPARQRSAHVGKSRKYVKQTAHVEARRDGKPLIFGWGGHLSQREKNQIKQRAIWAMALFIVFVIIATIVGFWININVISPNLPITSVNGQPITQSDYRKLLALKAQIEENRIKGPNGLLAQSDQLRKQVQAQQDKVNSLTTQVNSLNDQLKKEPAGTARHDSLQKQLSQAQSQLKDAQTKLDNLNNQYTEMQQNTIPLEQQKFTQSQQGSESVQWLQDDLLIRNWLTTQNNTVRAKIEPSASAVEAALRDFKANLPKSTSYEKFLSNDHVTDADIHAMMALIVRRTNMQAYLSDQVHSPAYQVQARGITLDTEQHANDVLNQLRKGGDFAKLAKEKSLDSSTKDKGGDFGWLAQGQYAINYAQSLSVTVDNWLFDPARKVNELSPVLKENGTFHIVQITAINRSRAIDSATINSLKTKAFDIWLLQQKALPGTKITEIDQSKMLDASNMPPNLPSAAPGTNPNTGLPDGGFPGGTGGTGGTNGQP